MKHKKFAKITFIIGLSVFLMSLILPLFMMATVTGEPIGIIGGSRFQVFLITLRIAYSGLAGMGLFLGLILMVISACCRLFKTKED